MGTFGSALCGPWAPACAAAWSYEFNRAMGVPPSGALRGAAVAAAATYTFTKIGDYYNGLSDANVNNAYDLANLSEGAYGAGAGQASFEASMNSLVNFGGNYLTAGQVAGQIASHAVTGGIIAELNGGKFGHGFWSAGFTKGVGTPVMQHYSLGVISGTVASAAIGGTASILSGGKFGNGAVTGVYQALFNFYGKNEAKSWITEFAGQYEISGTLMLGKYGFQFDIGLTLDADGSLFYHTQTTPYDEGFGVFGAIEIGGGLLQNKTPLVEGTSYSDSFKVAGAWRKGFGYEQSIGKGSFGVSGGKFEAGYGAMRAEGRTKTTLTHLWDF